MSEAAEVDHRLDGEGHSGLDPLAGAGPPEVRDLGWLVHRDADPVADHVANDAEAVSFDVRLDRAGNVADPVADLGLADSDVEGLAGDLEEPFDVRRNGRDGNRQGVVADVAVVFEDDVEGDDVALGRTRLNEGMPWTTSSLTEMQVCAG